MSEGFSAENARPHVLLVDDEQKYADELARYLEQNGIDCTLCSSLNGCVEIVRQKCFDAIVCDPSLPENGGGVALVKEVTEAAPSTPLIVVTAHPSLDTAIASVNLLVQRYLVKPVDHADLLRELQAGFIKGRILTTVRRCHERLGNWLKEVNTVQSAISGMRSGGMGVPVDTFVALSFANITSSLADLSHFIESVTRNSGGKYVCGLLDCPKLEDLHELIRYTVNVLDRTKRSFKSKEIGELRKYLEHYLSGEAPSSQDKEVVPSSEEQDG